jgi:hypothetical protein
MGPALTQRNVALWQSLWPLPGTIQVMPACVLWLVSIARRHADAHCVTVALVQHVVWSTLGQPCPIGC